MKSIILRIIPSLILVIIVRQIVDAEPSMLLWVDTIVLAIVWGSIHKFLGKPSSMTVIEWSLGVAILGAAIIFVSQIPLFGKIVLLSLCIYLGTTSLKRFFENDIKTRDNTRARKFILMNIYEARRIVKFSNAMYRIMQRGAKALNQPVKINYIADGPAFEPAWEKIYDMGYTSCCLGPQKFIILGRDGLVVVRLLVDEGDYEYKNGKWYKNGKVCADFCKDINVILSMLSKERGKNRGIIVKAFEKGSVNGADCGFYVTDITKGYDKFISMVQKTTRVENYKNKMDRKSDRVLRALGIE